MGIVVKGKTEPSPVWQPLTDDVSDEMLECFTKGKELYKLGQFADAQKQFEAALREMPEDGPSLVFRTRCMDLQRNQPPENWDGVWCLPSQAPRLPHHRRKSI